MYMYVSMYSCVYAFVCADTMFLTSPPVVIHCIRVIYIITVYNKLYSADIFIRLFSLLAVDNFSETTNYNIKEHYMS